MARSKSIIQESTAVILAGGKSSRMKCDKTLLPIAKQPMIEYAFNQLKPLFGEVLISTKDPGRYAYLDAGIVVDLTSEDGPIFGIVSALKSAKS